jgi:hypothetical protein
VVDVNEVADELYGLLPEAFTAARNAREKEAKAAGDKGLAAQIHGLVRPNQVGWLANQLTRRHPDDVTRLLDLGAEIRGVAGSLDAEQLREFSRRQRQQVDALVAQARQVARDEGKKVSEETARGLEQTLHAALADPESAERLAAGRLAEGMQYIGFGFAPTAAGPPDLTSKRPPQQARVSRPGGSPVEPATKRSDPRLERANKDRERATAVAQDAVEMADEARAELERADAEVARLDEDVSRLRDELDAAVAEQQRASRDQRRDRATSERADKAARDAVRRLEQSTATRQRLADKGQ